LLCDAVIFIACKRISRDRKENYKIMANEVINNYQWAVYNGETNELPSEE
jgi:hypothetical protein